MIAGLESVVCPFGPIPFVEAKYHGHGDLRAIRLIVVHTSECRETPMAARGVANYFAQCPFQASAHVVVDDAEIIQCVSLVDQAWHAAHVNPFSFGLELAGTAGQSDAQWQDDYSQKVLDRAAWVAAVVASSSMVPVRFTSAEDLKVVPMGFTGHVDCNRAFNTGTHWDPGPHFPWQSFLSRVSSWMVNAATSNFG